MMCGQEGVRENGACVKVNCEKMVCGRWCRTKLRVRVRENRCLCGKDGGGKMMCVKAM